jgi:hypothetical protein
MEQFLAVEIRCERYAIGEFHFFICGGLHREIEVFGLAVL